MGSSRYINKEGILTDAKRDAIALGGQLFMPRTGDDPVTLRVGNTTYTYWPPRTKEKPFKKDKTLFLHEKLGYRPDGGALERLESYADVLNQYKSVRQQLIGILQQHEIRYQVYDRATQQFVEKHHPKFIEIDGIEAGGLFNAMHQSLQDIYTGMQHSAQMLGKYLIRAKTDCLLVKCDCPISVEERVVKYWQSKGFRLKCKKDWGRHRCGWSYFESVDLGFIQGIPVGGINEVKRLIQKGGIELRETIPQEIVNRWQHWLV